WLVGARDREPAALELLELGPGGHLLGEDRGLDAVEQALEPADELRLGHPQLGLARRLLTEREAQAGQLLAQVARQDFGQLPHRRLVDLAQADAARLVERRAPHRLQQL